MKLNTHLHPGLRLKMGEAVTVLLSCLHSVHRDSLTLLWWFKKYEPFITISHISHNICVFQLCQTITNCNSTCYTVHDCVWQPHAHKETHWITSVVLTASQTQSAQSHKFLLVIMVNKVISKGSTNNLTETTVTFAWSTMQKRKNVSP